MNFRKILLAAAIIAFAAPASYAFAGNLSLSQTSVSVGVGQTSAVNIQTYGGEIANIVYNSGSNIASAVVNGNSLSLMGMSNGSSEIRVCTSSNSCGTVYVTVGNGSGNGYNGSISFSPASLSLSSGQTSTVSVYSGNSYSYGNYYVSNNSNSSVASAYVSGSTLSVTGSSAGWTNITVCQSNYSSQCGSLSVNVTGGYSSGDITFSPSSVNVNAGNTASVSIYHSHYFVNSGDNFYVSSNSNPSAASATVSGNRMDVRGLNNGSATLAVCNYNYQGCGSLNVTVSGYNVTSIWASPSSLSLNSGQTATASIYSDNSGYGNNYYVSNNSNSSVASAYVSGSTLYVTGNSSGSTNISVCTNNGNYLCTSVSVNVNGGSGYGYLTFAASSLPQPVINQYYSYQLSASNGTWPYNFYVTSGSLPSGLTLNSQGLIAGTPTSSGTFNFQVRVSDNAGRTAYQSFTQTVGSVSGASTFKNGSLIRENGTIFTVYKNLKSGFANMDAFTGLGYKLSNVIDAGSTSLANSSYVIGTSQTAHPWGTWIKQNNTIYFVHENGLIPVAYYDVFLNNGGEDRLAVPANSYDFIGKPVQGLMSNNDWRLR